MANHASSRVHCFTRILIKPHLSCIAISSRNPRLVRAPGIPLPPCRSIYAYAKAKPSPPRGQLPAAITQTLDERIGALKAHLVGEDNKLQEAESMRELLHRIDRSKEHVRKVGDGPDGIPVVKVVTRESLVQAVREKEVVMKKKDVADTAKQVELNWAISENDLGYRLKKIEEFLADGKRVEILIAPKRRGRRAERDEVDALLERIKECVRGVEGAEEWKEGTGTPGKVMEMYYKGPEQKKVSRDQLRDEQTEKFSKKEADKAERKKKQEERLRAKDEERKQDERERERMLKEVEESRQRSLGQQRDIEKQRPMAAHA